MESLINKVTKLRSYILNNLPTQNDPLIPINLDDIGALGTTRLSCPMNNMDFLDDDINNHNDPIELL